MGKIFGPHFSLGHPHWLCLWWWVLRGFFYQTWDVNTFGPSRDMTSHLTWDLRRGGRYHLLQVRWGFCFTHVIMGYNWLCFIWTPIWVVECSACQACASSLKGRQFFNGWRGGVILYLLELSGKSWRKRTYSKFHFPDLGCMSLWIFLRVKCL